MEQLSTYIFEMFEDDFKLTPKEKKKLLELDLRYHELSDKFAKEQVHFMNVTNLEEESKRIQERIKDDTEFSINIKYEPSKFSDKDFCEDLSNKLYKLRDEFIDFDCFISKYYLEMIEKLMYCIEFFQEYSKNKKVHSKYLTKPPKHVYDAAVEMLKENKYINPNTIDDKDFKRNVPAEESKKRLQKAIDKRKLNWEVKIRPNMVPRMSVRPYREFRISDIKLFSEVDLQSLEVHEVEVHTARKHWGLQSGLFLFLYGLDGSNIYDEGIAIYNSLNKTKKIKPNIKFNIAIKVVMLYHYMNDMTPLEIYKYVKKLTGAPDKIIIYQLMRIARVCNYTLMFQNTANSDSMDKDYMIGYLLVKDMTEEERQELIKYPIGPKQLSELENIKKFLKNNKFKPLKLEE
jgi:hypothetical protein